MRTYECPQCHEDRDADDVDEAPCLSCGVCGVCSPTSKAGGPAEYCAACLLPDEFRRVFGTCSEAADGGLRATGWPDAVRYDAVAALPVLRAFAADHGETEAGDARVCRALEAVGAVIA